MSPVIKTSLLGSWMTHWEEGDGGCSRTGTRPQVAERVLAHGLVRSGSYRGLLPGDEQG